MYWGIKNGGVKYCFHDYRHHDDDKEQEEHELGTTPEFRAHVAAKLGEIIDRYTNI